MMSKALGFGGFCVPMINTRKEWVLPRRFPILMANVPYSRKIESINLAIEPKIKKPVNVNVKWVRIGHEVHDDVIVPNGYEVRYGVVVPYGDEVHDRFIIPGGDEDRDRVIILDGDEDRDRVIIPDGDEDREDGIIVPAGDEDRDRVIIPDGDRVQNGNDTPITVDEISVFKLILGRAVLIYMAIKSVERIQNGNNALTTGESVQNDNDTPITIDERSQLAPLPCLLSAILPAPLPDSVRVPLPDSLLAPHDNAAPAPAAAAPADADVDVDVAVDDIGSKLFVENTFMERV